MSCDGVSVILTGNFFASLHFGQEVLSNPLYGLFGWRGGVAVVLRGNSTIISSIIVAAVVVAVVVVIVGAAAGVVLP